MLPNGCCCCWDDSSSSSSPLLPFIELDGAPGDVAWLRARANLDVSGADVAKAVGCSEYEGAEELAQSKRRERAMTDAELLEASRRFDNVHTRAGRLNEDYIALGVSTLLLNNARLYAPRLCVPREPSKRWYGATPDRLPCSSDEQPLLRVRRPLLPIECKFSFSGVPEYPLVDHVLQAMMQMQVLGASSNYLSYGTRLRSTAPLYDQPLTGRLALRVFKIQYSAELWLWIESRLKIYREMVAGAAGLSLPRMHSYTQHAWFESPACAIADEADACETCREHYHQRHPFVLEHGVANYLPPCPKWSLLVPDAAQTKMWVEVDG